jgi:hypothetical protein
VVFEILLCLELGETRLSSLEAAANWSWLLSWSLPSLSRPCSAMLPPPLDPSPCWASLYCRWPKLRSSTLSDPGCPLMHKWKIHPWASTACATILGLLLSSGKSDHLIWGFGPSSFLSRRCLVVLLANVIVMVISCVVASMAKTS